MSYTIPVIPRGTYASSANQYVANTSVEQAVTFNMTSLVGVSTDDGTPPTKIILPSPGDYQIVFSAMCISASTGDETVDLWFRKNGTTDVIDSNTRTDIHKKDGFSVSSAAIIVSSSAPTDYYELMMCASDAENDTGIGGVAASVSDPVRPAAPSIIVSVSKISQ